MKSGPNDQLLEGKITMKELGAFVRVCLNFSIAKGDVHSRFYYSADDKRFFHTNDPDTGTIQKHGIRDQT